MHLNFQSFKLNPVYRWVAGRSRGERKMSRLSTLIHEPAPLMLRSSDSLKRACEKMREHCASAVLVTEPDDGHLVGIFTGRDALWRVLATARMPMKLRSAK